MDRVKEAKGGMMTKIILLTGFLGVGKTTLLQSLLNSYKDQKIGVIVNEFGSINIDARFIDANGMEMAELSNGSVFCACIKDKFVDTLIEMAKREFDVLLIEASGLADPSSMSEIVDKISPYTGGSYQIAGMICVVDGEQYLDVADVLPALDRQIEYADLIIVNKMDLIDEVRFQKVEEHLKSLNHNAKILPAVYCSVDVKEQLHHLSSNHLESRETTNTYESRPVTVNLRCDSVLEEKALEQFLRDISSCTYRVKGFAETERGIVKVSAVAGRIELSLWNKREEPELVVISSGGIKIFSVVADASKNNVNGAITFR